MRFLTPLIVWVGRAISFVIFIAPAFLRQGLSWALAILWFDVFRIRRKVVDANIARVFPNYTSAERTRLGRKSLYHLALNFVEYSFFPWLKRSNIQNYVVLENQEVLQQALAKGKGALLLTMHLGHGDIALAGLSLYGFPMVVVTKFFKMQWLNNLWFGMRERLGVQLIPPRNSSYALLKSLKKGGAVAIPLDQFTGPPVGVKTTFCGYETGTAAGLAVMAERSGAPVVSVYTVRGADGRHVVYFGSEVPLRGSVEESTQNFNYELERFLLRAPEQWMWLHKRWKRFVVQ